MRAAHAAAVAVALTATATTACARHDVASTSRASTARVTTTTVTTLTTATAQTAPVTTTVPSTTGGAARSGPLSGRIVVVDPGHNGANGAHPRETGRLVDAGGFRKACNTTGTAEGGFTESAFNWQQAGALGTALEAAGATVVLTRTDDAGWGPCIDERGLTATRSGADVLVSIHADGSTVGHHGFHIASPGPIAGYTEATAGPSADLAAAVRDALVTAGIEPSNYVGRDGLVVRRDLGTLNRAGVPAVLIELGNLHDPGDLAGLRDPARQQRVADAIVRGIEAFLGA